jgi:tetratricopeptide (TPR) repeat protein/DNA-binding winged helix-turn-helix (wHTH) protein
VRLRLDTGVLDLSTRQLAGERGAVSLSPMEARALEYLAARLGEVIPQEELLREVWGYASAIETRTVRTTVGRLRNKLELDPASPRHLLTEHGFGYRLVAEVLAEAPARERTSAASTFGRQRELDALRAAAGQLVTLTGPVGVGRTHLAREVVRQTRCVWVDCGGVTSTEELHAALVAAVGREARAPGALAPSLVREHPLWVLDELEAPDAAEALRALCAAAPATRFLVTRRCSLSLPAEQVLPLEPLPLQAAVELLRHHLQQRDLAWAQPADARLERVVEALDRLPLAIVLAAPWVEMLGAEALARRLEETGLLAFPDVVQALGKTVAAAWQLLGEGEQQALAALSVCAGPVEVALAEQVIGRPDALGLLRRLLDQSWLSRAGPGQVLLLRALRGSLPALAPEPLRQARDRHVRAVLALLAPGEVDRLELLRAEALAALRHALQAHPEAVAPLCEALDTLFVKRGPTEAHLAFLDALPASARGELHGLRRARALRLAGRVLLALRELEGAAEPLSAAALVELGRCRMMTGRADEALEAFGAALQRVPDAVTRAKALGGAASALRDRGRADRAGELAREALEVLAAADLPPSVLVEERVSATCELGESLIAQGLVEEAQDLLEDAAGSAQRAGLYGMAAVAWLRLGSARQARGELGGAEQAWATSAELARRAGQTRLELLARLQLVQLGVERASPDCPALIAQARQVEQQTPDGSVRGWIAVNEALMQLDRGELDSAARLFASALSTFPPGSIDAMSAGLSAVWLPLVRGDHGQARAQLAPLLDLFEAGGPSQGLAQALLMSALAETSGTESRALLARGRELAGRVSELRALAEVVAVRVSGGPWPEDVGERAEESVAVRLAMRAARRTVRLEVAS